MGLDMHLTKRTYIGNDYKEVKDQVKIEIKGVKQERVSEIVEKVAYWRKANQIHNWFIENCADNQEDNCQDIYIEKSQLQKLLNVVNLVLDSSKLIKGKIHNGTRYENGKTIEIYEQGKIMENTKVAEKLLPTSSGFFFGSTDYDEYYYQDLLDTKKILEDILKENDNRADFYYRASW